MNKRKGATRRADVPAEILAQLNAGTLETATLAEGLALDPVVLMSNVVPDLPAPFLAELRAETSVVKRMALAGRVLHQHQGFASFSVFARHPSDTVRGWACYLLAAETPMPTGERIQAIRPLADDPHFGVREWAWMAIRPHLANDLDAAITQFADWVTSPGTNLRRFAVECLRPRGVWCSHIDALKKKPALGLPLLESVKSDPEKYVRDSVANWLNDAGKTDPDWVKSLLKRWQKESKSKETEYICRRAARSL